MTQVYIKQPQHYQLISILMILFATLAWVFVKVPVDTHQGEVYRILYIHVPSAFTAFTCSFILCIFSLLYLLKKQHSYHLYALSCAEVGFTFTILTLMTGSIWGKATWGTWWTWDARLTTTFILGILYAGYLTLSNTTQDRRMKARACAILGILIFVDVPIIYKSVTWWRTLHQPPSIMGPQGTTMSDQILYPLLICCVMMILLGIWFIKERSLNISLKEKIEIKLINQAK